MKKYEIRSPPCCDTLENKQALCEVLFKESPSVTLYDRLRVNINRLNRTFEVELGIAKPFKIREGHILTALKFQT